MAETTIQFEWRDAGNLTNVTSVVLSDPTGAFGVIRTDTSAVVVADSVPLVNQSTGVYAYTFTDPAEGLTYNYWLEVVYGGQTYRLEYFTDGNSATSTTTLETFWLEIMESIGFLAGWGRDSGDFSADNLTDAKRFIRAGLRMVYFQAMVPNARNVTHQWSFLKPVLRITTSAPYSTGTVTIVDGVVTLAGGTFPTWAAGAELQVGGANYEVETRDSGTSLTLRDLTVDAAALTTYELVRTAYDMPADFAMLEGPLTFRPGDHQGWHSLKEVPESEVRQFRRHTAEAGTPLYFSTRQTEFDATVGQRHEMMLAPVADDVYTLQGRYSVIPETIGSVSIYPHGGAMHAETFRQAILAVAEFELKRTRGEHWAVYEEMLAKSVLHDRQADTQDWMGRLSLYPDTFNCDDDDFFPYGPLRTSYTQ